MKVCTKCGQARQLDQFYQRKSGRQAGYTIATCKVCLNSQRLNNFKKNPVSRRAYQQVLYVKHREKILAKNAQWKRTNIEKIRPLLRAYKAQYSADKDQRTPAWADLKAIRRFYQNCPSGYEVDHVIPLRGKTISGLHVLENLQYLPKHLNRAKGNRF